MISKESRPTLPIESLRQIQHRNAIVLTDGANLALRVEDIRLIARAVPLVDLITHRKDQHEQGNALLLQQWTHLANKSSSVPPPRRLPGQIEVASSFKGEHRPAEELLPDDVTHADPLMRQVAVGEEDHQVRRHLQTLDLEKLKVLIGCIARDARIDHFEREWAMQRASVQPAFEDFGIQGTCTRVAGPDQRIAKKEEAHSARWLGAHFPIPEPQTIPPI